MGALCVAILLGLAASTSQNPLDTESLAELLKNPEVENLLKTLIAQEPDENGQGSPPKHKHHGNKHLNMMNIKNVNVVIKDNNLRKAQHQSSRSAKSHKLQIKEHNNESQRCKNGGGEGEGDADNDCPEYEIESPAREDLSEIINNLQQDVRGEQNPLKNLRCSCSNNQNLDMLRCGCKKRHPARNGGDYKDYDLQDDDDDDLEIIYLNKNTDLSQSNIFNLVRNEEKIKNKKRTHAIYGGIVPEETSEETDDDSQQNVSPQDFFKYYETFKAVATNNLLAHVLHQKSDVDVSQLSRPQQKIVKNLRQVLPKMEKVDILKLRDRLEAIIVGEESPSVVLPHFENNHNIYVPQWVYGNLLSLKSGKTLPTLRKQKPFPLTKQQKEKLNNMIKNKIRVNLKIPGKHSGGQRRSLSGDQPNQGLPFELQVDGLGQVNP